MPLATPMKVNNNLSDIKLHRLEASIIISNLKKKKIISKNPSRVSAVVINASRLIPIEYHSYKIKWLQASSDQKVPTVYTILIDYIDKMNVNVTLNED